ncbi:hypothetical protein [Paraburkholderia nemoris]|uniref:hypothetical protein n=1 Tax=Paraburkholderia nemoris TaxID=2793076 RepID=UPI001B276F8B|nr:hypothetical protein [Paraburkholderia nemoris]CAE6838007.1 hypothetical protein R75777_06927 [Paraburkholderia nemoris]
MPYYQDSNGGLHYLSDTDIANGGLALLPSGCSEITDAQAAVLQTPPAPTAAEVLVTSAQAALEAGLAIISTATPALNATYACDQLSQMDIIAIETSLNAGKGFPGGSATFGYPDSSGVMHVFTQANFTDFAAALRDYVYALKSVIAGVLTTMPGTSTTIA